MSRREFSKTVRAKAAERCKGHCEQCGKRLRAGEYHYDHIVPDGLGGEATLENCAVLCLPCHKDKTRLHDNPIMQKADRQRKSIAQNIDVPDNPMPFGRKSRLKRKLPSKRNPFGSIVDRATGLPVGGVK